MATYKIRIGELKKPLHVACNSVIMIFFIMAGPVINHFFLAGAWWIDLSMMVLGLMIALGIALTMDQNTNRDFETRDDAVKWLQSLSDDKASN